MTDEEKYQNLVCKINDENPHYEFELVYNIEPLPYARPRKSRRLEQLGKKNVFYNPRSGYKKKLEKLIDADIANMENFKIIEGEVELYIEVGLKMTESIKKSKSKLRLAIEKILRPIVRPDIDNYAKPILDVFNDRIYKDDGQVVALSIQKVFSEEPYIKINVIYRQDKIKLR
jgi:Holliday junction resolvase RusA-like endonuclease